MPEGYPPLSTGLTELLAAAENGDTVSAPEGTYRGSFTVPIGVTLQPADGARVVIDVTDTLDMSGATLRNIELFSSYSDRYSIQTGVLMFGANSRLVGCVVHDLRASGVQWFSSGVGEISECLFFNNGYLVVEDASGHGHCIYSHNHGGGARLIDNNILIGGYGKYALHIYSGGANRLRDYNVTRNITALRPTIIGGGLGVSGLVYDGNAQHNHLINVGLYSAADSNIDCVVTNNALGGDASIVIREDFDSVTETGNETVSETRVIVHPCTQARGKLAHIAIFNPALAASVDVDLSALALNDGDYRLVNAQNLSEAHSFTKAGSAVVALPMSVANTEGMTGWGAPTAPIGSQTGWGSTLPAFGAFILEAA